MNEGRLVSSKGLDMQIGDYEKRFTEEHVHYSTTLHTHLDTGNQFMTGPLARFNLNRDKFSENTLALIKEVHLENGTNNPFRSLIIRMIETFHAIETSLEMLNEYDHPGDVKDNVEPRAGKGEAVTEAPRGILYHGYEIDERGDILKARIVAPTSHNQRIIEDDLRRMVEKNITLNDQILTEKCEHVVRNYDPCISCSTHFLKLDIQRE
jgi:coenzyme F420-reducing hydrogenase alpha subunit